MPIIAVTVASPITPKRGRPKNIKITNVTIKIMFYSSFETYCSVPALISRYTI